MLVHAMGSRQISARTPASAWRLELFFKNKEELQAQLSFLRRHSISRVNITNKTEHDNLLESVRILQTGLPQLDVAVHYSVKYNYQRTPEPTYEKFVTFCHSLDKQLSSSAAAEGHVLLVSGGGKKKQLDSLAILQKLSAQQQQQQQLQGKGKGRPLQERVQDTQQQHQQQGQQIPEPLQNEHGQQQHQHQHQHQQQQQQQQQQPGEQGTLPPAKRMKHNPSTTSAPSSNRVPACKPAIALHVAFNPYLQDPHQLQEEQQRLQLKLRTGLVKGIYLQMGTDLGKLKQGLKYLNSIFPRDAASSSSACHTVTQLPGNSAAGDGSRGSTRAPQQQHHVPDCVAVASMTPPRTCSPSSTSTGTECTNGVLVDDTGSEGGDEVTVFGSVFLPSKRLLAQMRFRPWNGVFLSEQYLSSVEAADRVTRQVLKVYAEHGVVPLVESAVRSDADMAYCQELLAEAYRV